SPPSSASVLIWISTSVASNETVSPLLRIRTLARIGRVWRRSTMPATVCSGLRIASRFAFISSICSSPVAAVVCRRAKSVEKRRGASTGAGFRGTGACGYRVPRAGDGWGWNGADPGPPRLVHISGGIVRRPVHRSSDRCPQLAPPPCPLASCAQGLFDEVELAIELGVVLAQFRHALDRVHHGGVVATPEGLADLGEALLGEFLGEVHRDLARPGNVGRATLGEHVGDLDPELLGHRALDLVDRDGRAIEFEEV